MFESARGVAHDHTLRTRPLGLGPDNDAPIVGTLSGGRHHHTVLTDGRTSTARSARIIAHQDRTSPARPVCTGEWAQAHRRLPTTSEGSTRAHGDTERPLRRHCRLAHTARPNTHGIFATACFSGGVVGIPGYKNVRSANAHAARGCDGRPSSRPQTNVRTACCAMQRSSQSEVGILGNDIAQASQRSNAFSKEPISSRKIFKVHVRGLFFIARIINHELQRARYFLQ